MRTVLSLVEHTFVHIIEEIPPKIESNIQSFSEIWHGKTRKEIMEKLDPRKHCEFHCIRHNTNKVLEDL